MVQWQNDRYHANANFFSQHVVNALHISMNGPSWRVCEPPPMSPPPGMSKQARHRGGDKGLIWSANPTLRGMQVQVICNIWRLSWGFHSGSAIKYFTGQGLGRPSSTAYYRRCSQQDGQATSDLTGTLGRGNKGDDNYWQEEQKLCLLGENKAFGAHPADEV